MISFLKNDGIRFKHWHTKIKEFTQKFQKFLKKGYKSIWRTTPLATYSERCIQGEYDKFPDFFVWALLLIDTWNYRPLRSNLPRLQCNCCIVPTTSGRPHGCPLVWACPWPFWQPLSSPQLFPNDSHWA